MARLVDLNFKTLSLHLLIKVRTEAEEDKQFANLDELIDYLNQKLDQFVSHFYRFVNLRPRSNFEVQEYLKKKMKLEVLSGPAEVFYHRWLEKLVEEKIINSDKDFVLFWLRSRSSTTPRSLVGIKYELRQKRIDRSLIDQVVSQLEEKGEYDELEALELLYRRYRNKDWQKFYQAARRYRFNPETIKRLKAKLASET